MSSYVNYLGGLGSNAFHIKWRFGTHGSLQWDKILKRISIPSMSKYVLVPQKFPKNSQKIQEIPKNSQDFEKI